jgi:hypothetical protein
MLLRQLCPISLRKAMHDWYVTPACIHDPMMKLACAYRWRLDRTVQAWKMGFGASLLTLEKREIKCESVCTRSLDKLQILNLTLEALHCGCQS